MRPNIQVSESSATHQICRYCLSPIKGVDVWLLDEKNGDAWAFHGLCAENLARQILHEMVG